MIRAILLLMLALQPAAVAAEIRAVFVGVDVYLYSETKVEGAGFGDLRATVADVARIKAALRAAYQLDLDEPETGRCRSANMLSITVTDHCATRRAILDALDDRIAASAAGDTLLFYFAGHGGQYVDTHVFDQPSGTNVSILPADARKPGAESQMDILDREIRLVIDRATAKGINVVTIFDSCHSESAGRGDEFVSGWVRGGTPVITVTRPPVPPPAAARTKAAAGYRVHFAAAREEQDAREVVTANFRGGVFTTALADALVAMPHATFHDIAEEVRLKVEERGLGQQPHAEGALSATLGGAHRRAVLLAAAPDGEGATIAGGRLSGVTEGSRFALFASTTAALDGKGVPLVTGIVRGVDVSTATLVLDAAPSAPLPARLVARETEHAFADQPLLVRLDDYSKGSEGIAEVLAGLPFARIGEPAQLLVSPSMGGRLLTVSGELVGMVGKVEDPSFPARLGDALRKVARANALLALRTDPSTADSKLCFAGGEYDVFDCAAPEPLAAPPPREGQPAQLTVINRSDEPRFLYVFAIDPRFGITLVLPPHGGKDPAVSPHLPLQRSITPPGPNLYRFVTVATDAPIDPAAFEQEGIGGELDGPCSASLEPGRCAAASSPREASIPRVAKWSVTATAVMVERPESEAPRHPGGR